MIKMSVYVIMAFSQSRLYPFFREQIAMMWSNYCFIVSIQEVVRYILFKRFLENNSKRIFQRLNFTSQKD